MTIDNNKTKCCESLYRAGPQFSDMTLSDCSVFIVTKNIGTDDD